MKLYQRMLISALAIAFCGLIAVTLQLTVQAQTPTVTIAVSGPTLTLTPTAAQMTALQFVVDTVNASNGTTLTVNQWLRDILLSRVQSAIEARKASEAKTACDTFEKLNAADQKIVTDKLGGKVPCAQ